MTVDARTGDGSRLAPLSNDQWGAEHVDALRDAFPDKAIAAFQQPGLTPNVLATMLHHPALAGPFNRFGNVLLQQPAIGHRARELMLLRVAWRTRAQYEWVHHVRLAERYGLTPGDIAAIASGTSESWTPLERDLVAAADELLDHYRIEADTWSRLAEVLDERQLVELPFIVGTYTCLAMAFNSWGLQVEDGVDTSGVPPLPTSPFMPSP
ncbi:carboxymuconolactone decarboxylase family protein [Mycobacterium sp. 050128]|uniref:carboxymuconolactone decarboxylase family protein n=1 Tax=Mycobacterium sp. 050128 TaxID=3096112 RepID=UPI002ED9BA75